MCVLLPLLVGLSLPGDGVGLWLWPLLIGLTDGLTKLLPPLTLSPPMYINDS